MLELCCAMLWSGYSYDSPTRHVNPFPMLLGTSAANKRRASWPACCLLSSRHFNILVLSLGHEAVHGWQGSAAVHGHVCICLASKLCSH